MSFSGRAKASLVEARHAAKELREKLAAQL
jgi:hypothetical protein